MIGNLPNAYSQQELIQEMNSCGFEGCFDFLYVVVDCVSGANKGYAFVNFLEPQSAYEFFVYFHGRQMDLYSSKKRLVLSKAHVQGYEANRAQHGGFPAAR